MLHKLSCIQSENTYVSPPSVVPPSLPASLAPVPVAPVVAPEGPGSPLGLVAVQGSLGGGSGLLWDSVAGSG